MGNKITEKLRQGGFTLMEMIAAMVVMGSVMVGVYSLSEQSLNNTKSSVLALHLRTVGDAANQYINAKTTAIMTHLAANPTTPYLIEVGDLTAGGYLPSGYSSRNSEGQIACVLVLKKGNNLNALVVTEGGNTIDDLTLGQIAATIGGSGGGIYSSATTTVKGAMGGWSFPVGDFANANSKGKKCVGPLGAVTIEKGHPAMALWLTEPQDAATLYRNTVPGNEALNTMNTPIIMGAPAIKTEGSACGGVSDPDGAIARAPDGSVLSCVKPGNTWQKPGGTYWRDPVSNFASLPTTDPDGAVRMTRDTGRAFVWNATGAAWRALAVDQNGDLNVSRDLMVGGKVGVASDLAVGGQVGIIGSLDAAGKTFVAANNSDGGYVRLSDPGNKFHTDVQYNFGGLEIKNSAGTRISYTDYAGNFTSRASINAGAGLTAVGLANLNGGVQTSTVTATGALSAASADIATNLKARDVEVTTSLQLKNIVTVGTGCSPNGMIARDANGELLSCVSGAFKYVSASRGIIGGGEVFATEGSGAYAGCNYQWGAGMCTGFGFACSEGVPTIAMTAYDNVGWSEAKCGGGRCHVALYYCIK